MTTRPEARFEVGVLVAKRRLNSRWASHAWVPHAVLPAAPDLAPWTRLSHEPAGDVFYAGPFEIGLHPSETAHYRDNLTSGRPSLWIALRPRGEDGGHEAYEVATVTADPYQGEALAEGIGEIVEPVPMPPEIQAKLAAFFNAFHRERPFLKRQRDRADPQALSRGKRPSGEGER